MASKDIERRRVLAGLGALIAAPALAQPVIPPARLAILDANPSSHRLSVKDVTLDDGSVYRLFLAAPSAPPPPGGWPILYLLDGNGVFDALTAETLAAASGFILAGIGYPTELRFEATRRALDYTPPIFGHGPEPDPERPARLSGGSPAFLARLSGPLRQAAEAGLPVAARARFLWGHSFGGLFSLFTLFAAPEAFAGYAAISPSIWWGGERLTPFLDTAPWPPQGRIPLFLAMGDSERRSGSRQPVEKGASPRTLDFAARIGRAGPVDVETRVFAETGHGAALAASLLPVFEWVGRKAAR